ncbi:MAG: hypothetical protein ACR2HX_09750 [Pyrinomonadaceae bacterium]
MPSWLEGKANTAKVRSVGPNVDEDGNSTRIVWELNGGSHFQYVYSDGTEFVLDREGTEIWARWPDTLTLADTATYFLGPILGFLLRLRGFISLHASAIVVKDSGIALLGPARAGKSTAAATFADLGYPVVSDDVLAIIDNGDHFLIQPAYPRIRLWPESVNALYGTADHLPRLTPTWDKRYLDLTDKGYRFQPEVITLAGVFLLGERREDNRAPYIEKMSAAEKMMSLVGNSYASYMLDKQMRSKEFEVFNRLVATVPVQRIIPHRKIERLPRLCQLIVEDSAESRHAALVTDD